MTATDIFLLTILISLLGVFIFTVSAIVNVLKKEHSKDDLIKAILFLGLTFFFFVLFGISLS